MANYTKILTFAEKLAQELGQHIQDSRNRIKVTVQKDIVDICTNIDQEVENLAVAEIQKHFPHHNIHSEECGLIDRQSEYTWYLDPIDGTKEYIRGIPAYDTCITYESSTQIHVGVVYLPVNGNLWSTTSQTPATKNAQPIQVNQNTDLKKSIIYFYVPNTKLKQPEYGRAWDTFKNVGAQVYRMRGSALNVVDICYVAEGLADGFISLHANVFEGWHDLAAGVLMVEQAGGRVSDIYGKPLQNRDLSNGIVITNGRIHDQLLARSSRTDRHTL